MPARTILLLILCVILARRASSDEQMICSRPRFWNTTFTSVSNKTKLIVVLGSSTAAGVGASNPAAAWVSLLTASVAKDGFRVRNSSISGSTTSDSIARFGSDVVAYRPDFVLLATSLWNEDFADAPVDAGDRYLTNTRMLVNMVRSIGSLPVVIGPYPNTLSSPVHVQTIKSIYKEMETFGVPIVDCWNASSDPSGRWLPGLSVDGTHPTDLGHRVLYDAFPTSLFSAAYGYYQDSADTEAGAFFSSGEQNIAVALEQPTGSWSAGVWEKECGSGLGDVLSVISDSGKLNVVRSRNSFDITLDDTAVFSAPVLHTQPSWRHIVLTYNGQTGSVSLYLAGRLRGAAGLGRALNARRVMIRGCQNCELSDFVIYRSPLALDDVSNLARCVVLRKSLEFWAKLDQPFPYGFFNSAHTSTLGNATPGWLFDADSTVHCCERRLRL